MIRFGMTRYFFLLPAVIFIVLLLVYPLVYNIDLSVRNVTLQTYMSGTSQFTGLTNYQRLVSGPLFQRILMNTLIFAVGSIAFQFLFGFLLALLFNRDFPFKGLLQGMLMLPWFVPIMVSGNVFRWFFSEGGTINGVLLAMGIISSPIPWITSGLAIYSVTIANIWLGIPFNFILLYTGLKAIPIELFECASIDGAKGWQTVLFIILPILKPVTITTLMLGSIFTIKVFDLVWIITRGGPGGSSHLFSTLSYELALIRFRFGEGSALAIIMVLMVALITFGFHLIRIEEDV